MSDLQHTATIKLNISLANNDALDKIVADLRAISSALSHNESTEQLQKMEKEVIDLKGALSDALGQIKTLQAGAASAGKKLAQSVGETVTGSKRAAAAIEQVTDAEKARRQAMTVSVSVFQKNATGMRKWAEANEQATAGLVAGMAGLATNMKTMQTSVTTGQANLLGNLRTGAAKVQQMMQQAADREAANAKKTADRRIAEAKRAEKAVEAEQARLAAAQKRADEKAVRDAERALAAKKRAAERAANDAIKATERQQRAEAKAAEQAERVAKAQAIAPAIKNDTLKAIADYKNKVGQLSPELVELAQRINAVEGAEKSDINTLRKLTEEVKRLIAAEQTHDEQMGKSLKYRLSYYEKQVDAVFRAAYRMQQAGRDMMNVGRQIFQFGTGLMNTFGDFEYTLARAAGAVEVFTRDTKDGVPGVIDLQNAVLDTSVALRMLPAEEVAQGLYYWGSATGVVIDSAEKLKSTMEAVEPIMQASLMTGATYESTVKGVYSILTQYYNGSVSKAADVTRELFYVTQKTAAEFGDLVQSFKMVGPIAAQNNTSFEELVELFGRLADLGVKGTMAGRSIRQMFVQLLRPSAKAKAVLTDLFMTASQGVEEFRGKSYVEIMFPEGKFVGVTKYISNLAKAVSGLDKTQRSQVYATIATSAELPTLTALVEDQVAAIKGLNSTTKESGDIASRAREYFEKNWEQMSNTWKGVTGLVQRMAETLKISIGTVVSDALKPFLIEVAAVIQKMQKWAADPSNKKVIDGVTKLVAAFAGFSFVGGAVLVAVGAIMRLVGVSYVMIRSFAPLLKTIGAVAGAFVALTDAVIRNWADVQGAIEHASKAITEALGGQEEAIDSLGSVMDSLLGPTQALFDIIVKTAAGAVELVSGLIELASQLHVLEPILKVLASLMGAFIAMKTVTTLFKFIGTVTGLSKAFGILNIGLLGVKKSAADTFLSQYGATQAATGIRGLIGGITNIRGALAGLLSSLGPIGIAFAAIGLGSAAYSADFLGFKGFIDRITDSFRDTNKEIKELTSNFGDLGDSIKAAASKLVDYQMGAAGNLGATIEESGPGMPGKYKIKWTDESGKEAFTYAQKYEDAVKFVNDLTTKYTANMISRWTKWHDEINTLIGRTVSDTEYSDTLSVVSQHFDPGTLESPEPVMQALIANILRDKHTVTNRDSAQKLYNQLKQDYGYIFDMTFEEFSKWLASPEVTLANTIAAERLAASTKYAGPVNVLTDMLSKPDQFDPEQIQAYLHAGTGMHGSGKTIADLLAEHAFPPELEQAIIDSLEQRGIDFTAAVKTAEQQAYEDFMTNYTAGAQSLSSGAEIVKQMAFKPFMDSKQASIDVLNGIINDPAATADDLDRAGELWLTDFKQDLIDGKFPKVYADALLAAGESLIGHGGITSTDLTDVRKRVTEQAKEDTRTILQIVNDSINSARTDALNEAGQGNVQTWMSNIARIAIDNGNIAQGQSYFLNQLLPLLRNTEMDKETIDTLRNLASFLFPGIKLEDLMNPITSQVKQIGGTIGKAVDKGKSMLAAIYKKYSMSGTSEALAAQISQGQTVANNSNPAFVQGWDAITQFGEQMALGTEEGYAKALVIYGSDIAPLLKDMPDDLAEQLKSAAGVAEGALGIKVPVALQLEMDTKGYIGTVNAENASKSRRDWLDQFVQSQIPTPKEIRQALKKIPSGTKVMNQIGAALTSGSLASALNSKTSAKREYGRDTADSLIDSLTAQYNAGGKNRRKSIRKMINKMLDDKNLPTYVRTRLEALIGQGVDGVEVKPPAGEETKTPGWLETIFQAIGLNAHDNGEGKKKDKPANVYLRVHMQQAGSVAKTVEAVEGAYTKIAGFLAGIDGMGWASVGTDAGTTLASSLLAGVRSVDTASGAREIKNKFAQQNWSKGGAAAGHSWGMNFTTALKQAVDPVVYKIARLLVGESPPPEGPLSKIDKGGANAGHAWAQGFGDAARKKMMSNAQELRTQTFSDRMGLVSEEKYDAKKTIDIHLDVTSKDGSVDRAKQGEFRKGMMDVMVAADLEHYVTVS